VGAWFGCLFNPSKNIPDLHRPPFAAPTRSMQNSCGKCLIGIAITLAAQITAPHLIVIIATSARIAKWPSASPPPRGLNCNRLWPATSVDKYPFTARTTHPQSTQDDPATQRQP
jgi:hypothetical protein